MYYASHVYCPCAVAIFENADDRDRWVHYLDQKSKELELDGVDRTALSYDQARKIIGASLDDDGKYYIDENGMTWVDSETQYSIDDFQNGKSPTVFDILGVSML